MSGLKVLLVDEEQPVLDELAYLLGRDPRIGETLTCHSSAAALNVLHETDVDAVFLDINMPGLSGIEMAQVLSRFKNPPPVVFVTAHEEHAVRAFDLRAVDYVLKPVREQRLSEAVRRIVDASGKGGESRDTLIPVERGGVTRFIRRSDVTHVEATGDYVRLHTSTGSHLLRVPLTKLADDWAAAGFVRIHRSMLVSLAHVAEVRTDAGHVSVLVGTTEVPVSRRHTRELRDLLTRRER